FLLQVIHEHAPHIVKYALYDMGYRAGAEVMGALAERSSGPEGAFRYFVETYRQAGYGNLEVVNFDLCKPEITMRGTNLIEPWLANKAGIYRPPRAVHPYNRGMLAGFMSPLIGREAIAEELACQYRGDLACQFVLLARPS